MELTKYKLYFLFLLYLFRRQIYCYCRYRSCRFWRNIFIFPSFKLICRVFR